jgi:fibronectin-binding autotransporter adhesin
MPCMARVLPPLRPFAEASWPRAVALAACFGILVPRAHSQTLIWVGGGANFNWSTTGNWNSGVPSTLAGDTQALDFTGSTGLAQTMNNSYSVGSLTFDSAASSFAIAMGSKVLTIDGSAPEILQQSANAQALNSGTLAFASDGIIDVTGNGTLSISSKSSGTANITKQGAGVLAMSGAGTAYSGTITIATGTLQVSTSNTVLGTGAAVVDSGATLDITDGRNLANALTLTGTGSGGGGALESDGSGTATVGGAITLGGDTTVEATAGTLKLTGGVGGTGDNLTLAGAGSFTVSGAITTGSGTVTINSSGTTTLSGANTYTGLTTVNAGTVDLSAAINGDLTITGGTVLDKASGQLASTTNLAINGGEFNLNNKTESIGSVSGSSGGTAVLALGSGTLTDSQTSTTSFDGSITGTGTLAMQGTGTLNLTDSNTAFTGKVNVTNGTVNASAVDAAGSGTVTVSSLGNFQVQGGVSLASKFDISNTGGGSSNGAIENVSGTNTLSGAVTVSGASRVQSDSGTLTFSGATGLGGNSLNVGGSGNTAFTGAITGTAASAITKDGTGMLSIGVANPSFAGTVTVSNGTLQTTVANAFKTTTAITFSAGSILDLASTSQAIGTLNGAGTVAFGSGGALTLGTGTDLLSGAFTGAGTLTLGSGTTLTLGANFSDANLNIVLAGGTLKLNGSSDTFGSLSITGSSTLDFANPSTSILTVNGVTLAGSTVLSVTNWANLVDYFYSTTSPGPQGTAPINQIVFTGYSGNLTHWNATPTGPDLENEITPIPEATSYGLIIGVLSLGALALWRGRRES